MMKRAAAQPPWFFPKRWLVASALTLLLGGCGDSSSPWSVSAASYWGQPSQQHTLASWNNNNNKKKKDSDDEEAGNTHHHGWSSSSSAPEESADASSSAAAAAVGLKDKQQQQRRKGNAVGDPDDDDGSDDDDSDDDDDIFSDEEESDDAFAVYVPQPGDDAEQPVEPNFDIALELVETAEDSVGGEEDLEEDEGPPRGSGSSGGGGVGLVRRWTSSSSRRNNKKGVALLEEDEAAAEQSEQQQQQQHELGQELMWQAWQPHLYQPPSPAALEYLAEHAASLDAAGRTRLDRRTLYAGLLLEWGILGGRRKKTSDEAPSASASTASTRTFLDPTTSHTLRSTLALATQPQWRHVLNHHNQKNSTGICLYTPGGDDGEKEASCTTTLSMQETICTSLAHSLGASMLILDDQLLATVRSNLLEQGLLSEDQVKPAMLLQALFQQQQAFSSSQRPSTTTTTSTSASMAAAMHRDMHQCLLDDPHDPRALQSIEDMKDWEQQPQQHVNNTAVSAAPPPLVILLRVDASPSLLKSKSAVDALLEAVGGGSHNNASTSLLILAKGTAPDAAAPPPPPALSDSTVFSNEPPQSQESFAQQPQQQQQQHPWFGFSPHNQGASGQFDPAGSRRFNIFLARTTDAEGNPGILGAVAPPQAGNLFPQIMALQAQERLQHLKKNKQKGGSNDNTNNAAAQQALEQWANMFQQQQQDDESSHLSEEGEPEEGPQQQQHLPQFFNASLSMSASSSSPSPEDDSQPPPPPPPEVIQETLQRALREMLDQLAEMSSHDDDANDDDDDGRPELHRAFAQVLRNESLRRGIMENLARAAPALSDPKCQGVMLSVYVPPPPGHGGQQQQQPTTNPQQQQQQQQHNMNGWFQRILHSQQQEAERKNKHSSNNNKNHHQDEQRRIRTQAAAAAVAAAHSAQANKEKDQKKKKPNSNDNNKESSSSSSSRAVRNLKRLEAHCSRHVVLPTPSDPIRAKSWDAWKQREQGAAVFLWNRHALQRHLNERHLSLQRQAHRIANATTTTPQRWGSALRSMLSVRDVASDVPAVLTLAVELEAEHAAQRQQQQQGRTDDDDDDDCVAANASATTLVLDASLDQVLGPSAANDDNGPLLLLHPSTLENALMRICRISPSPHGGQAAAGTAHRVVHRTREETMALAQDKHEKALVSQVVNAQDIGVTYDMIGGLKEVKELLRQSITYPLKFPHLYSEGIAKEAVKGVLLFGPPGTGKTMLAKAVATEGGASFLSVDASSVENKWLGESEKNAKAVFTLARRLSPCVVFIDEVDSLLSSREGSSDDSAHGTLTSVKTTMMSEWDGLNSGTNGGGGDDRVIVVGSTNRPFDLDEAVLRRFPRRLLVDLPDLETRREILAVTLAENRLAPSVNLTRVAERLEGYTGSDIKEVCREAVVQISHEHAQRLDQQQQQSSGGSSAGSDSSSAGLRPVEPADFDRALSKLKRSVSETGRELERVWQWNAEYGEIKRHDQSHKSSPLSMFL